MKEGYIKLSRKVMSWEWWKDRHVRDLWFTLLLLAVWKDCKSRGVDLKRGQLAIPQKELAEESGLSRQEVRTALSKLESTGEITLEKQGRLNVITIVNYELYQGVRQ